MGNSIIEFVKPQTGNFLVDIIYWLVKIGSSVTLGVVLFTVLLKLITLPFDFMSRASMRKNSLKMEQMRPELEKLQKQYADNKQLYNQKMMALYKKNGYSMFGSCLPTIITLVIFIIAINAFTNYSTFQNRLYVYNMSQSYNGVVYSGIELDKEYIVRKEEGNLTIDYDALYEEHYKNGETKVEITSDNDADEMPHDIIFSVVENAEKTSKYFVVETTNSFVKWVKNITTKDGQEIIGSEQTFIIKADKLNDATLPVLSEENGNLKYESKTFEESLLSAFNALTEEQKTALGVSTIDDYRQPYAVEFIKNISREKSAESYRAENVKFLWVKNLWITDSPMKHPVESNWETYKGAFEGNPMTADYYSELTYNLEFEKNAPNGYFILVILTAVMSFVMQAVMAKSQKAQMELQTVDGRGAQTQKVMKWMMPILMAVFAFMYTAAFSLYIIISNALSMASTYGINFIVDRRFKKKEGIKEEKVIRGRVYTPKQEEKEDKKSKKEKKKKDKNNKNEPPKGDFLSGTADAKKHVRGRLK